MQSDKMLDIPANDLPSKRRKDTNRRKKKDKKERGGAEAPRFTPTKKRTKFNKHQLMRML